MESKAKACVHIPTLLAKPSRPSCLSHLLRTTEQARSSILRFAKPSHIHVVFIFVPIFPAQRLLASAARLRMSVPAGERQRAETSLFRQHLQTTICSVSDTQAIQGKHQNSTYVNFLHSKTHLAASRVLRSKDPHHPLIFRQRDPARRHTTSQCTVFIDLTITLLTI